MMLVFMNLYSVRSFKGVDLSFIFTIQMYWVGSTYYFLSFLKHCELASQLLITSNQPGFHFNVTRQAKGVQKNWEFSRFFLLFVTNEKVLLCPPIPPSSLQVSIEKKIIGQNYVILNIGYVRKIADRILKFRLGFFIL